MANFESDAQSAGGSEMQQQMAEIEAGAANATIEREKNERPTAAISTANADDKKSGCGAGEDAPAGGSTNDPKRSRTADDASGESSPGTASSHLSAGARAHSRTPTSDESLVRRSFSRDYNFSPAELDSDQEEEEEEDELDKLLHMHAPSCVKSSSVGVQTEHDDEFPSLKFLQSLLSSTEALKMPLTYFNSTVLPHQQQMIPPPPLLPSASTQQMDPSTTMVDDPNCIEGTLQLVIQNFRHMADTVRGPSKVVQSVPWRIMVMPRQHVVQKKGTQKCLGFFLQCCPDAYSDSWSCQATAELRLISQKPGIPNFTRKTSHSYTAKENDWGYSCFMTWADILDETQGYIRDDKVVLEVYVKAEPPKNVLSHKEFQKKIQDYKRLADVQCQRGLIDKAIECNAQALKFCKDKDSLCKIELESQKAHLIEMKLKQSIERIEKGSDVTKGTEEDPTSNIAALRSALNSGAKAKGTAQTGLPKVKNNGASKDSSTTTTTNANAITNRAVKVPAKPVQSQKAQKGSDSKSSSIGSANGPKSITPSAAVTNSSTTTTTTTTATMVDSLSTARITRKTKSRTASENNEGDLAQSKSAASAHSSAKATSENSCRTHIDSKALVALGHFNKALLDSDELDYVTNMAREKYLEEEELLPGQIKHYLQHLSERGKEAARLKRFSTQLEFLTLPLDETSSGVEAFFNELPKMTPDGDGDMFDFEQIEQRLEELRRKNQKGEKTTDVDELCDFCTFRKRKENIATSESGCQTDFTRRLSREDAAARLMELHAQQQQIQQLQQLQHRQVQSLKPQQVNNKSVCNDNCRTPPSPQLASLSSKPRKKATAKKTSSHLQHAPQPPLQPPPPHVPVLRQHQMALSGEGEVHSAEAPSNFLMPSMIPPPVVPPPPTGTADLPAYFQASGLNMNALAGLTPEMAARLQEEATLLAAAQQQQQLQQTTNNLLSRQYIEEWLKLSKNPLGYNAIPGAGGKPLIVTRSDDGTNTQHTQMSDAATPPIGTHMGGLSCLNAKSIQQRLADFLAALESNSNIREMRSSVDRLLALCNSVGDDADTVSIVSTNDSSNNRDPIAEAARDFPILPPSLQQAYAASDEDALSRELRQAELMLATRLDTLIYQLHSANLTDVVERMEGRVRSLVDRIREVEASDKAARSSVDALKNSELHAQKALQVVNEKVERSNQQLKEKKNEIKKLEKRLKSETQLSEENGQLHEKVDSMKKELASLQKQLNEEQLRYKRDTQSLADSKKHLGVELTQLKSSRSSEAQKLANQLEEKNSALKKVEGQLLNERKSNASTMSSLTERVKRAEVALLEHKLEDGLKVLERAKDDCHMQIRSLEEQLKRHFTAAEQEVVKRNIAEWETKKEEVAALIAQANKDFAAHIHSIKSGKQVAQLTKVQVPRPPPCPRLHPMPTPTAPPPPNTAIPLPTQPALHAGVPGRVSSPSMTVGASSHHQPPPPMVSSSVSSPLPLERKVITPPSSRGARSGAAGVQLPQAMLPTQPHHSPLPHPMGPMGNVLQSPGGNNSQQYNSNSNSASASVTPIKFPQQAQSTAHLPPPPSSSPLTTHHMNAGIAPIGVRPANYPANGVATTQHGGISGKFAAYNFDMLASGSQFGISNPASTIVQCSSSFASSCLQPQAPPAESVQLKTSVPSQQPPLGSNATFQAWSGWGGVDQPSSGVPSNISDIFGRGRSFGPLGSDFGNRSTTSSDANNGVGGTTGSGTATTGGFYS